MSSFLEQVRKDIKEVFLNTNEVGKIIKWNGEDLTVAEDVTAIVETQFTTGVNLEYRRLVFGDKDLERNPTAYETVTIDGEPWYIRDVRSPSGFIIVTIERNTG